LVSQILRRKRRITSDRALELGRLCGLKGKEKHFFCQWIIRLEAEQDGMLAPSAKPPSTTGRKAVSDHLLKDWLNIYVKDAIRLAEVNGKPELLYQVLGGIASQRHVERSVKFLLREGYLRTNEKGQLVEDHPFMVTGDGRANAYIRRF